MQKNNGITLIALVITIIVLLILAGISIMMLSGDNGILTRAKEAKDKTEEAQDLEILNMKILESSLDDGTPNINTLIPQLQEMGCTVSGESYPLSVELKGKNYQIDSEGTLKNVGSTEELTKEENYLIVMASSKSKFEGKTNVGTIEEFRNLVNSGTFDYTTAILYENIELNGSETNTWIPIGTETNKFTKVFDGRNYSINGLYSNSSEQGQGLFKYSTGTIQNVTVNGTINCTAIGAAGVVAQNEGIVENCISNVEIIGNEHVGGIVGYNSPTGNINNCTSNGFITGAQIVGGVTGGNDGKITGCTNNGKVTCTSNENSVSANSGIKGVGGITGYTSGNISNSKNTGEIDSGSEYTGGIVGRNDKSNINKCFNDGNVMNNGQSYIGGIIGCQFGNTAAINYCYNNKSVRGTEYVGGIVGRITAGSLNNCYNIGEISSSNESRYKGGIAGACSNNSSINNSYCLQTLGIELIGHIDNDTSLDDKSSKKSQEEMISNEFVTLLNSTENNFKKGLTYPILTWQK